MKEHEAETIAGTYLSHPDTVSRDKGLLGLELTDHVLRYIYLKNVKGQYKILEAGQSKITFDLSASGSLSKAVYDILIEKKLTPQRVFVTVSRSDTVIQLLDLPKMPASELQEVITGEIDKIPLFRNQDYDYISQHIPANKDHDKVLFAAISRQNLESIIAEIQKVEIPFRDLEITPLNLKRIIPLRVKAANHCHATLIIHDTHTYLTIIKDQEYSHIYTSPIGMDRLSAAHNDMIRENIVSSWLSEIQRVFQTYLVANSDEIIDEIFLVWDKEKASKLDERVAAETGKKVETISLDSMFNIAATKKHHLNPIYVLALVPILHHVKKLKARFSFQHFFRNYRVKAYFQKMILSFVVFFAVAAGLFMNINQNINRSIEEVVKEIDAVSRETAQLQLESKELYAKKRDYERVRDRLLSQATYVQQLNRVSWSQVLYTVSEELPEELALTSFKFGESGRAEFKGHALYMESVANLIRRIDDSKILSGGKFDFLKEQEKDENKYFSFGILANLRQEREKQP
jgi:Tfp pilus assembly PilM family ATPase/Tfp pilus assembly protein PilN